jgi:hypothetical protein
MTNPLLVEISAVFLLIFAVLSLIDGVYLHLWKYGLQEREESRFEHWTHSLRSIIFIPVLALLFLVNSGGAALWLAVALLVLDLGVEAADVLSERASRRSLGGLSSGEYLLHVVITTVRVTSLALVLAAKPIGAWALTSPWILPENYPNWVGILAFNLIPGSVAVAALHVALIVRPMLLRPLRTRFSRPTTARP